MAFGELEDLERQVATLEEGEDKTRMEAELLNIHADQRYIENIEEAKQ